MKKSLYVNVLWSGKTVQGKVVALSDNFVLVELPQGSGAVVHKSGKIVFASPCVADTVSAYINYVTDFYIPQNDVSRSPRKAKPLGSPWASST